MNQASAQAPVMEDLVEHDDSEPSAMRVARGEEVLEELVPSSEFGPNHWTKVVERSEPGVELVERPAALDTSLDTTVEIEAVACGDILELNGEVLWVEVRMFHAL